MKIISPSEVFPYDWNEEFGKRESYPYECIICKTPIDIGENTCKKCEDEYHKRMKASKPTTEKEKTQ